MLDRLVDIFLSGIVQALVILLLTKLGMFPMLAVFLDKEKE